ncbi:MAG: PilZ domain-containing protein, partial [Psychrosphaera sp.]|nr:PilZ domain-containing protein [Psychrosphaera sp.]
NTVAIAVLTDITEQKKIKQYQAYNSEAKEANKLKIFGVPRPEAPTPVEIVAVDYVNLRKETRFLYRTKATIEQPPGSTVLVGATRDFSTKGMQIELSEPCEFEKGSVVLVSFPEMQKITRKFKLSRLPYEAVAISKNKKIVNVRIHEMGEKHSGKKFFQQLIQTNRSKLTAAQETQTIPGMPLAMRNMFVNVCSNMPFYIHRKGIRYMINTIGRGGQNNSLHRLMARFSVEEFDYHLQPLIKGNLIETLFANVLKSIKRQDPPIVRELLVRVIRSKKDVESAIEIEFSEDLSTEHSHKEFVETATKEDLFFAYRIYISRTGRPDIQYIAKELKYVGNYAIHRAKVLEEELWGVIGVGDAIDISEEMLVRYGVSDTDIQIQNQAKRFYFTELAGLDP